MGITYTKNLKIYKNTKIHTIYGSKTLLKENLPQPSSHAVDHISQGELPLFPFRQGDPQYHYKVLCVFQLMEAGGLEKMLVWECTVLK
jgi:hypothetical protein